VIFYLKKYKKMLQEIRQEIAYDPEFKEEVSQKINAVKDQNYATVQKVLKERMYECEMGAKLLVAMEGVIENQIEENEKLELVVQDQSNHIEKLSNDLSKYTGEANEALCEYVKTVYQPKAKSDLVSKSKALILKQLAKNKQITN